MIKKLKTESDKYKISKTDQRVQGKYKILQVSIWFFLMKCYKLYKYIKKKGKKWCAL